ncbi:tyrosine-type recombinase/integrase [Pseudonocardia sp. GCM10023141]|uniref:tyrosine-type recombinase/integrase n=1 Tax=Pseudonocardia sp. GCM10023141 TaxID=3252653 RepID=UPI0036209B4E
MVFRRPKRKSRRVVTFPVELVAALREQRAAQNVERLLAGSVWEEWDLIFGQPNGRPIDPRAGWAEWSTLLEAAMVRRVRVHDGRHTAAKLLIEQGVHIRAVRHILGHSDARTTEAYTHVGDHTVRDAAARMGSRTPDLCITGISVIGYAMRTEYIRARQRAHGAHRGHRCAHV